jgi:hypothetical protein
VLLTTKGFADAIVAAFVKAPVCEIGVACVNVLVDILKSLDKSLEVVDEVSKINFKIFGVALVCDICIWRRHGYWGYPRALESEYEVA